MIEVKSHCYGKLKYLSTQLVLRYDISKKPHKACHILVMFFNGTSANIHGKLNFQSPELSVNRSTVRHIRARKENVDIRGSCSNRLHILFATYPIRFNKRTSNVSTNA